MTRVRIAPGRRRMTLDHCRAAEIAARFDGLPAGVTKRGQLLPAFKRACPALGISARLRDAVDTLMSWSRDPDWLGDSRPIVWPSNQELQDAWDVGKRQVQNILTALIRLGLVAARDGADGRRGGKRDGDGVIIEAFGFDLSPLAVRHAEFLAAAAEHKQRCAIRGALRRRLSIARSAIRQIAETALEQRVPGRDWRAWLDRADSLCRGRPADLDLDILPALVEQVEAVRTEGEAALGAWLKTVETSSAGAPDCTLYTATNTLPADKSATCNEAADEQVRPQRCGFSAPPDQARPAQPNTATAGLAPAVLAKLCSPLRVYLASGRPAWPDLVDAADFLRAELGISRSAWIDACHTLGRNDAAAAVAIIAVKGSEIASAGGYLRGMTARARAGRLNLQGSLWGLAERCADDA